MKRFLLFLTAFLPFIAQAQIVPETAPDVKSDNVPVVKFGYLPPHNRSLKNSVLPMKKKCSA